MFGIVFGYGLVGLTGRRSVERTADGQNAGMRSNAGLQFHHAPPRILMLKIIL